MRSAGGQSDLQRRVAERAHHSVRRFHSRLNEPSGGPGDSQRPGCCRAGPFKSLAGGRGTVITIGTCTQCAISGHPIARPDLRWVVPDQCRGDAVFARLPPGSYCEPMATRSFRIDVRPTVLREQVDCRSTSSVQLRAVLLYGAYDAITAGILPLVIGRRPLPRSAGASVPTRVVTYVVDSTLIGRASRQCQCAVGGR